MIAKPSIGRWTAPLALRSISSAKMFSQPDGDVVLPQPVAHVLVQLAGLGVHEVGRERAGVATEQHVGQRDVAPVEAGEVQPDQQHDDRVDQRGHVLGVHPAAEEAAVGQGEPEVVGDQRRGQVLAVATLAAGDDALRDDRRHPHALEVAQHPVLPERDVVAGLLDGVDAGRRAARCAPRGARARVGAVRRRRPATPRGAGARAGAGWPGPAGWRRSAWPWSRP